MFEILQLCGGGPTFVILDTPLNWCTLQHCHCRVNWNYFNSFQILKFIQKLCLCSEQNFAGGGAGVLVPDVWWVGAVLSQPFDKLCTKGKIKESLCSNYFMDILRKHVPCWLWCKLAWCAAMELLWHQSSSRHIKPFARQLVKVNHWASKDQREYCHKENHN